MGTKLLYWKWWWHHNIIGCHWDIKKCHLLYSHLFTSDEILEHIDKFIERG